MISLDNKNKSPVIQTVSGAGTSGTASSQVKEEKKTYHSKPELYTEMDQYKAVAEEKETARKAAYETVLAADRKMAALYQQTINLKKAYDESPSELISARWEITHKMYEDAVNERNRVATVYNSFADEAEKAKADLYSYEAGQAQQYADWRATVRTPEQISAEQATIQPFLDAAEKASMMPKLPVFSPS